MFINYRAYFLHTFFGGLYTKHHGVSTMQKGLCAFLSKLPFGKLWGSSSDLPRLLCRYWPYCDSKEINDETEELKICRGDVFVIDGPIVLLSVYRGLRSYDDGISAMQERLCAFLSKLPFG